MTPTEQRIAVAADYWIIQIARVSESHKPECACSRCKNGHECFLIPSDIEAIQRDARRAALTEAAASVDLEEELEGDMPVAILAALARSPETVFRANVRATKASIKRRILAIRDERKGGGE